MPKQGNFKYRMVGDKFGDLLVLSEVLVEGKNKDRRFLCECSKCGRTKELTGACLRIGKGIYHEACARGLRKEHPRLQRIWQNMKTRVSNPNFHAANAYSKKGVKCPDWEYFIDFFDDMADSYYTHVEEYGEKETTLERLNVEGDYCKENCVWATWEEQHNNTTKLYEVHGISPKGDHVIFKNISKFGRENDISDSTIQDYLRGRLKSAKGWHFWREV